MKKLGILAVAAVGVIVSAVAFALIGTTSASSPQGVPAAPLMQPVPPTPTLTPPPTPPPPLTDAELEEFVGSLCNNVQPWWTEVQPSDDRLRLAWDVDPYEGPHTGPRYDGYGLTFRIERRAEPPTSKEWRLVANVTDAHEWEGRIESGEWLYRMSLASVTHQGETTECPGGLAWAEEVYVSYFATPTAEELAEFARSLCRELEVVNLAGEGAYDDAYLYWDINANDIDFPSQSPLYEEFGVNFTIRWRPESSGTWRSAEHVTDHFWWDSGYSWDGEAPPGRSVYEVAVSSIRIGGQTVQCRAPLRWAQVSIETPTEAERAKAKADRQVLIAEATRCAKESLTRNISEAAQPIINEYVERLIEEEIADNHYYDRDANHELAAFTVMMCGTMESDGTSIWPFFLLFGIGF